MMTTIALVAAVIIIEAVPVSGYMGAIFRGEEVRINPTMIAAFAGAVALCAAATAAPLIIGLRRMESFEF
jgi:hypothetical protein